MKIQTVDGHWTMQNKLWSWGAHIGVRTWGHEVRKHRFNYLSTNNTSVLVLLTTSSTCTVYFIMIDPKCMSLYASYLKSLIHLNLQFNR